MISYTVKENHIGSAVTEILNGMDRQTSFYLIIRTRQIGGFSKIVLYIVQKFSARCLKRIYFLLKNNNLDKNILQNQFYRIRL